MARRGKHEGTIYQRANGSWRTQVNIDNQRFSYTGDTKKECQNWLVEINHQNNSGIQLKAKKILFEDYLLGWLDKKQYSLKEKTFNQYEGLINKYIIPQFGSNNLGELQVRIINQWVSDMISRDVGVRTIKYAHCILKSVLKQAVIEELIPRNPASGTILPREKKKKMKVWNENQVQSFLIAAGASPLKTLYYLATNTGMRIGELLGLKWEDICWNHLSIFISRHAQYIPHKGMILTEPKTSAAIRTIILSKEMIFELESHRIRQRKFIQITGEKWENNDLIFPSSLGTIKNKNNLYKDFYRIIELAGIPKIRFHDMRHTAATLMITNGVPINVVSKILGHSNPSITLSTYTHCMTYMQEGAAEIMAKHTIPIQIQNFPSNKSEKLPQNYTKKLGKYSN